MNTHPDRSHTEGAEVQSEFRPRRAYVPPQLVDVGDVVQLTHGTGGPYVDAQGNGQRATPLG